MDTQITMSIGALIAIIAAAVGTLSTVTVYIYKKREEDRKERDTQREVERKEIIELTKTFTESTVSNKLVIEKVLENNTAALNEVRAVIKELPDQIVLHVAAARKQLSK